MKKTNEEIHNLDAIMQKGHNAMLDEIIQKHINPLFDNLGGASIEYFLKTGQINGEFLLKLRKMLDHYGEICEKEAMSQAVQQRDEEIKEWINQNTIAEVHPEYTSCVGYSVDVDDLIQFLNQKL